MNWKNIAFSDENRKYPSQLELHPLLPLNCFCPLQSFDWNRISFENSCFCRVLLIVKGPMLCIDIRHSKFEISQIHMHITCKYILVTVFLLIFLLCVMVNWYTKNTVTVFGRAEFPFRRREPDSVHIILFVLFSFTADC